VARPESRYVCQACGASSARWEGRCHVCAAWDTLVETVVQPALPTRLPIRRSLDPAAVRPQPLRAVGAMPVARRGIGIGEVDRVLGGGLVPGSVVLLGGEPGIGKSTLVLETAAGVARSAPGGELAVLYASGEESAQQLHLRADRLGLTEGIAGERIHILAATELELILAAAEASPPHLLIVDSVQTMTCEGLEGPAGSVGQVREAASRLAGWARQQGVPVILVGHVTKDGSLAGPRTLEHLVDAVLLLEGDRYGSLRILRAAKNRFGSTEEVGVLEMTGEGLREVADPARAFLGEGAREAPGVAIAAILEGTRPLLVEVQALVAPGSGMGAPRRTVAGVDSSRVALLLAVLARRCGIDMSSRDVYLSLAGGASVEEPAVDLAVALALASSARDRSVASAGICCGEVSLLGELRPVRGLERRLREAARLGFRRALVPADIQTGGSRGAPDFVVPGLDILAVHTLGEALERALTPVPGTSGEG
jgi:DNA repair protein RadA/Sms